MTTAFLLLAAAVGWMLYRRQLDDGTLPGGLTIRGAQVAVTNVDAVERRRVWRYRGPEGLQAVPAGFTRINRRGWTLNHLEFFTTAPPGTIVLVPGRLYSSRVLLAALRDSVAVGVGVQPDWLAYDSWWAPVIVTVSEAQQLGVVEVPANLSQTEPTNTT